MRYHSTGGSVSGLSFEEALFTLYAADGGLLMPESVPALSEAELAAMSELSYLQLCCRIGRLFIDEAEISTDELTEVLIEAYRTIEPDLECPRVHQLTDRLAVLEMFNTPTLCFKDYAMCFATGLMAHFIGRRGAGAACVSLVATSGDTGGAAIRAVESQATGGRLSLIVLLPEGRVSDYQRVAMTTSTCQRVRVASIAMDSDRLDDVIRAAALGRRGSDAPGSLTLCTQNSANWGRVLFQIPAFFYAYFRASQGRRPAKIFVPTGGCGNLVAASLARRLGLPIGVCAATNQNAAAHALIGAGRFQQRRAVPTTAVAMDIANPYNVPRLLTLFIADRSRVSELAKQFDAREALELTDRERADLVNLLGSESATTSDADCLAEIVRVYSTYGYLACPHTACALHPALAECGVDKGAAVVVFATAHPGKFADLYRLRSLPVPAEPHPSMERLARLPENCEHWGASFDECVARLNALIDELAILPSA